MKKKSTILIGSLLVALLVILAAGAAIVYAQAPSPTPPAGWPGKGPGAGHSLGPAELAAAAKALGMTTDDLSAQLKSGKKLADIAAAQGVDIKTVMNAIMAARPMMLNPTDLAAAANALGMTTDDLSAELKSGKTLSDIATEKGLDLQKVKDAITSARHDEIKAQINQAVTDGKMTQDKANWLIEGLDKGYLDGPGFGFGFGFGPGFHGFNPGQKNQPPAQPTQPSG